MVEMVLNIQNFSSNGANRVKIINANVVVDVNVVDFSLCLRWW